MKKALITILAIAFCVSLAGADDADTQKYQLDFALRYNAVDADQMAAILKVLEQLRESVGGIEIEPCKWKVEVVGKAGTDGISQGWVSLTVDGDTAPTWVGTVE